MLIAALVIGYLKLSAICVPVMAAIAIYDTHMYPMCPDCHGNFLTHRPKLFSPLAMCRQHGWIPV